MNLDPRGTPFHGGDLAVVVDHEARHVVIEIIDPDGSGMEVALPPEQALEAALRLAAAVAKLMRIAP